MQKWLILFQFYKHEICLQNHLITHVWHIFFGQLIVVHAPAWFRCLAWNAFVWYFKFGVMHSMKTRVSVINIINTEMASILMVIWQFCLVCYRILLRLQALQWCKSNYRSSQSRIKKNAITWVFYADNFLAKIKYYKKTQHAYIWWRVAKNSKVFGRRWGT